MCDPHLVHSVLFELLTSSHFARADGCDWTSLLRVRRFVLFSVGLNRMRCHGSIVQRLNPAGGERMRALQVEIHPSLEFGKVRVEADQLCQRMKGHKCECAHFL